jgi:hypothetical protein
MNKENPIKYSLQISTCEAIIGYSKKNNVSLKVACNVAFHNLKSRKNKKIKCGFNLNSPQQFYSSFRRFKSLRMKETLNNEHE